MNVSNSKILIVIKKIKNIFTFPVVSLAVLLSLICLVFMSFNTLRYYQAKNNQWFDFLPSQTVFAVKLNTHSYQPVQNTKLFGVFRDLNFDQSLIDEFIHTKQPISLVFLNNDGQVNSGVVISDNSNLDDSNKFNQYALPNNQKLISTSKFNESLTSPFDQNSILTQIKNHPGNSFGYVALSPKNFQETIFKNKLLTPSQKALESLLKKYDNIFFNIESDSNKLYISNYLESNSSTQNHLLLEDLNQSPSQTKFHLSLSSLESRMPKILNKSLEHILQNFGVSQNLYQKLLNSSITTSLDNNNQWQLVLNSKEDLSDKDLKETLNFLSRYFNPTSTSRVLKTDQKASINISVTNSESVIENNTINLISLNKRLQVVNTSPKTWQFNMFSINTEYVKPELNFIPSTVSAFDKVIDYSKFRLDFLSSLFGPKLPSYAVEIFQRDYNFGTHTLIVIE